MALNGCCQRIWRVGKQLQQALIADAVRQTSYEKLFHMRSSVLIESIRPPHTKTKRDKRKLR